MKVQSFVFFEIIINLNKYMLPNSSMREGKKEEEVSNSFQLCLYSICFPLFLSSSAPVCILYYVF